MERPLIHIGYHKTASSWLQFQLFNSTSKVFAPLSTRDKGQSSLAKHLIYSEGDYLLNPFFDNEIRFNQELESILDQRNFDNKIPVLSQERLSGNPHSSGFDASIIARRIQRFFPDGRIFIMIREQNSWILSNFFEYVSRGGGTDSINTYLTKKYDGKRPGFSPHHLEYHHLISDYQQKFGVENVLVIPFELFVRDKDLFLQRLSNFIERDLSAFTQAKFDVVVNKKENQYSTYALRHLNPILKPTSLNHNSLLQNTITRKVAKITRNIIQRVVPTQFDLQTRKKMRNHIDEWTKSRYHESNKKTEQLTGLHLSEFGYQ